MHPIDRARPAAIIFPGLSMVFGENRKGEPIPSMNAVRTVPVVAFAVAIVPRYDATADGPLRWMMSPRRDAISSSACSRPIASNVPSDRRFSGRRRRSGSRRSAAWETAFHTAVTQRQRVAPVAVNADHNPFVHVDLDPATVEALTAAGDSMFHGVMITLPDTPVQLAASTCVSIFSGLYDFGRTPVTASMPSLAF